MHCKVSIPFLPKLSDKYIKKKTLTQDDGKDVWKDELFITACRSIKCYKY